MYSTKQYNYIKQQTTIFILVENRKMNLLDSNWGLSWNYKPVSTCLSSFSLSNM